MTTATETTYLSPESSKSLCDALSRAQGHIGAVRRMIEDRRCCDEVLTQVAAVRGALSRVAARLIEEELQLCLTQCAGEESQERMKAAFGAMSSLIKQG